MSSLFTQINKISQEAQQQRSIASQEPSVQPPSQDKHLVSSSTLASTGATGMTAPSQPDATSSDSGASHDKPSIVTSPSDVATSQSDVTMTKTAKRAAKRSDAGEGLGKGSRIDLDKLKTIVEQLSELETNTYGFSVRMSKQEKLDIQEFILDTLRKEGLSGYEVSTAKLMRYAMRYMFRVHPQEFVTALRAALEVEETLSI